MPGGRRNPHEFGGCAPDSEVFVDVELYSRLRIGAAIARGHPTEVAVAMSELAVLLDCWWNQSDKLAKEMVFEDVMAAARGMSTIGGERQVDAGSRLMKSAQRVLKAQKKAAVEKEFKRSTIARKRLEKRGAVDSDEDGDGPLHFTELPQDIMDLVFRKLYAWDLARAACVSRSWRDTARHTLGRYESLRDERRLGVQGVEEVLDHNGRGKANPTELKWEHIAARTLCASINCTTPHWSSEGFKFYCLSSPKYDLDGHAVKQWPCLRKILPAIICTGKDGVPTPRMRRSNLEVTDLYMYSKSMLRHYLTEPTSSDEDTDSSDEEGEGNFGDYRFWRHNKL